MRSERETGLERSMLDMSLCMRG